MTTVLGMAEGTCTPTGDREHQHSPELTAYKVSIGEVIELKAAHRARCGATLPHGR